MEKLLMCLLCTVSITAALWLGGIVLASITTILWMGVFLIVVMKER